MDRQSNANELIFERLYLKKTGIANYLYDKGIIDMSTYIAGSSGGGLYLSKSQYLCSHVLVWDDVFI